MTGLLNDVALWLVRPQFGPGLFIVACWLNHRVLDWARVAVERRGSVVLDVGSVVVTVRGATPAAVDALCDRWGAKVRGRRTRVLHVRPNGALLWVLTRPTLHRSTDRVRVEASPWMYCEDGVGWRLTPLGVLHRLVGLVVDDRPRGQGDTPTM